MAQALKKITGLECNICADRYERPKILDCLHSFCAQCLEKYYTSRYEGAPKIPCPVCRRDTTLPESGVQGLKTNFHLMGIVEEVSLQETVACEDSAKVLCELCEGSNEALRRCLDCAQNICSGCHKTHQRCAGTSNHTVATFEEIRRGDVTAKRAHEKDGSRLCNKHPGEAARFFCQTCAVMICGDCTVVDHCKPQHQHIDSGEAAQKCRATLREMLTTCEKGIDSIQQCLDANYKQVLANNIAFSLKAVQDRAAEIIGHVKRQETKLVEQIKQFQKEHNNVLDEHDKALNTMLQEKQHSLQTSKDVLDSASDSHFLSLYAIICKDSKSLEGSTPPKLPHLTFTPGNAIDDIDLGTLGVQVSNWEMVSVLGKRASDPGKFKEACGITATQAGDIAVADPMNKRVVIYSTEGHHKRDIPFENGPCDIEVTPDNRLVVVDGTRYVKVFDEDYQLAFQFPTVDRNEVGNREVYPRSIAIEGDGTIVVGDVRRSVRTRHRPTDGDLLDTIRMPIKPWSMTINSATDRVAFGTHGQVVVATSKGTTLHTIQPTIDDESLDYICSVYLDDSGTYVALPNVNHGHVHHYGLDGRFLECLVCDLDWPLGITFTPDGKLAVADRYSVKIYQKVLVKDIKLNPPTELNSGNFGGEMRLTTTHGKAYIKTAATTMLRAVALN